MEIGTDIVEIQRFENLYQKFPQKLAERLLSDSEAALFQTRLNTAARFLAKQFAAKEAVAKALGTGISGQVTLKSIEVLRAYSGAPTVKLTGGALERFQELQLSQVKLSLSDERHYCVAMVVMV